MSNEFSDFPSYVERSSPKPRFLVIFLIVLFLIIAALAGLYFLGANSGNNLLQTKPVAPAPSSPLAQEKPTATPVITQPQPERSELTVAILNGSGTAGAARGISSYLNGLGYDIGPIANANKFTYTGITVHVKTSSKAFLSQLEKDLKENDPDASISASIDDSIATEAEVIVGR